MRFAFWSLAVVVALAPLPFASNRPWAWSLLAVLVALLLALWAVDVLRDRAALAMPLGRVWPMAAACAVLLALFAVQVAPMTPAAWHHPLWAEASAVLGRPLAGTISLDPGATITAAMRFATYGAIFWIALQGGAIVSGRAAPCG
ncbi:MAG: hypothetical protein FJX36_01800 [Alphaproteobacteria bacterium]|nr:hypothetical protein [Alphaproteobacteria bacterium]